jgi:thiamine transporter ThiT
MLKYTYKNRISLISSLFWGLMALIMVYLLYGIVNWLIGVLDPVFIMIYDCVMGTAMSFDSFFTIRRETVLKKKFIAECEAAEADGKENGEDAADEQ